MNFGELNCRGLPLRQSPVVVSLYAQLPREQTERVPHFIPHLNRAGVATSKTNFFVREKSLSGRISVLVMSRYLCRKRKEATN
jgi:hypothetical protein